MRVSPSAAGTVPTISNGTITTDSTTRGVYTLTCSLTTPALTASGSFTVLLPADPTVNTQQATFAAFSATTTMTSTILKQVNTDLAAGNQSAVNADLAELQAALNAVDFDALTGSAAFAPEGGFPAAPGHCLASALTRLLRTPMWADT